MDEVIRLVAKYAIVIPVVLSIVTCLLLRNRRKQIDFGILVIAGGILSLALAVVGSHIINDPRPFVAGHFTPLLPHGNDNGFPSDHTLLASFLGFAILRSSRLIGFITLAVAACIGIARVLAGIHHLEDIIGSFVITAIAAGSILLIQHALARPATEEPR